MKKIVLLLLAALVSMPLSAAYSGQLNDKISWTLTDAGALVITGTGDMPDYEWGSNAPYYVYRNRVKSVIVGNGITSLGNLMCNAFENLTTATLPSTIKRIGTGAFISCYNLNDFEIPQSVTIIGDQAFFGCACKELVLPAKLDSIGIQAFYQSKLTKITLPSSLRAIGTEAFDRCSGGVTEVTIPESVKYMGNRAFSISTLKTVNFNAADCDVDIKFTDLSNDLGCLRGSSVTTINIGPNVQKIPQYLANTLTELANVNIASGSKLREIGKYAFDGCTSLARFDAPNVIIKIGSNAFRNTAFLTGNPRQGVYVGATLCKVIDDGVPFDFYVEEGTLCIGTDAFAGTHVSQCVYTDFVTTIHDGAFANAKSLYGVWLPASVTNFGRNIFAGCTGLKSVFIFAPIKKIPYGMFSSTGCLAWMELPETVEEVESFAFYNGWSGEQLPNFPHLKVVGNYAFSSLRFLKTIDLPQGVTTIGDGAFNNNPNVTTVNLPTSLRSIGEYAFQQTMMASIVLPEGLKTVGRGCFNKCTNLKTLTLPRSLTYIPEDFVTGGGALAEIYVPHTTPIDFDDMAWTNGNDYNTYEKATVYVPRNCAVTYAMHGKWGRFNHIREYDAPQGVTGDANGDGKIDVADINVIINIILAADDEGNYGGRADVNSDGKVDVADINVIINLILAQ